MVTSEVATGRVLVIEDDAEIADVLRRFLRQEGHEVRIAADGEGALPAASEFVPDLVILDLGLPGVDGVEVCRRLRASGDWTPVLFVTARDDEVDRIVGLELGADDYVTKPFSPRELAARVRTVLRRAAPPVLGEARLMLGDLEIDASTREVT